LDAAIRAAEAPMVAIPPAAKGVGDGAKGAADGVDKLGKSAKDARQPLQDLLDTLFPEEAGMREAQVNLALLKAALDNGKISADRYAEAVMRVWRNYLNIRPLEDPTVSVLSGEKSIEELNEEA